MKQCKNCVNQRVVVILPDNNPVVVVCHDVLGHSRDKCGNTSSSACHCFDKHVSERLIPRREDEDIAVTVIKLRSCGIPFKKDRLVYLPCEHTLQQLTKFRILVT